MKNLCLLLAFLPAMFDPAHARRQAPQCPPCPTAAAPRPAAPHTDPAPDRRAEEDAYTEAEEAAASVRPQRSYLVAADEAIDLRDAPTLVVVRFVATTDPEEWERLRRRIVVSELPARDRILAVIDTVPDPRTRLCLIRSIDGGRAYEQLLREFHPRLRRVECSLGYSVVLDDTEPPRAAPGCCADAPHPAGASVRTAAPPMP